MHLFQLHFHAFDVFHHIAVHGNALQLLHGVFLVAGDGVALVFEFHQLFIVFADIFRIAFQVAALVFNFVFNGRNLSLQVMSTVEVVFLVSIGRRSFFQQSQGLLVLLLGLAHPVTLFAQLAAFQSDLGFQCFQFVLGFLYLVEQFAEHLHLVISVQGLLLVVEGIVFALGLEEERLLLFHLVLRLMVTGVPRNESVGAPLRRHPPAHRRHQHPTVQ